MLRGRAHEADVTASDRFDAELRTLSRLQSEAKAALSRITWRIACQKRTARIASVLRSVPTIVGGTPTRTKKRDGWHVMLDNQLVLVVAVIAAHTLDEMLAPVPVRVHRPALVDLVRLADLERGGTISIALTDQH